MKKEAKELLEIGLKGAHEHKMKNFHEYDPYDFSRWSGSKIDAICFFSGWLSNMCINGYENEKVTLKEVLQMLDQLTFIDLNEVNNTGLK